MSHIHLPRVIAPAVTAAVVVAAAAAPAPAASAGGAPRAEARAAAPPALVTGSLIRRQRGTLAPGTPVAARTLFTPRVFTSASRGYALADTGNAQYPAASSDGGRTWRTDGPALHLDAAQAPLAVTEVGAGGRTTVFAWGGGGQAVDVTTDGGGHWYRALFQGAPMAVVRTPRGRLLAYVDDVATSQYVSRDGGRTWRLQPGFSATL